VRASLSPVLSILDAARRPRVANRAAINRQRQFTNGKLLRSCYAFFVLPFAPRMLAAVDLAKIEHAHPLGAPVPDNLATDFDLGGHGSHSGRRRSTTMRLGSSAQACALRALFFSREQGTLATSAHREISTAATKSVQY
jgi:hypothetical protein